jgi:hypothetical protein
MLFESVDVVDSAAKARNFSMFEDIRYVPCDCKPFMLLCELLNVTF